LERTLGIPQTEYINISEIQEQTLQGFRKYKEIVLWFEHDLFDQTMLVFLLHWFAKQPLGQTQLNLLCIGEYPGIELFRGLGQLTAKQLEELSGTWHPIGRRELELGSKVWEAYASHEVDKHIRLLQEDTSALPFVRAAFEAHLSRLPSTHNGLGSIEQTTLEMVAGGINKPFELFDQVGNKLNILGMGDLEYWYRLAKMSEQPYPLLSIEGLAEFPNFKLPVPSFGECVITLTKLGGEVLAGNQDWAAVNGMDEWFGGLHLQGQTASWRWDASQKKVAEM
jgi:hypothetical protein